MLDQPTINTIISLSKTRPEEELDKKKSLCLIITKIKLEDINVTSKWGISSNGDGSDLPLKPQYLHAALACYFLLKYEQTRRNKTNVDIIILSNVKDEFLLIATHVLSTDPDGIEMINKSDDIFNNDEDIIIKDEYNSKILNVNK